MKRRLFILITLAMLITLPFAWGCSKKEIVLKKGPTTSSINLKEESKYIDLPSIAKASPEVIKENQDSATEMVSGYLEKAFLDLNLANQADYAPQVLEFFAKDSHAKAKDDFGILSLGNHAQKLQSIEDNELAVPIISIYYDKLKKPSLGSAQIDFTADYKTRSATANLKYKGWLGLSREGNDWKIFDYRVEQRLE